MMAVRPPATGDDWIALTDEPLPVADAYEWAVLPNCGGTVVFSGTVRDHAEGRTGVTMLSYEAYAEQVEARLAALAADARVRWPELGRVVLLHRLGDLALCESSVVLVGSAPRRAEAFDAARRLLDTLEETVPIRQLETLHDGADRQPA